MKRDGLDNPHIAAYAVGHVLNDASGAMGGFYLAWYLNVVCGLSSKVTAACYMSGLICDGATTPIVGIASDMCNTRVGKRMPWYYVGVILVIPSFLGLYL